MQTKRKFPYRLTGIFCTGILICSCAVRTNATQAKIKEDSSASNGISSIKSLDFSSDTRDLKEVSSIVGEADVVGLGEAHHTVGGYHRVMARMTRYLIENMGFKEVAIETPWDLASELSNFVATCEKPADQVMQWIFPQFASQELLDLFKWIHDRNCSSKDEKIVVYGFDTQESQLRMRYNPIDFRFYLPILMDYIQKYPDAADQQTINKIKTCGKMKINDPNGPTNATQLEVCHEGLTTIGQFFNDNKKKITQQVGQTGYNRLRYATISLWSNAGANTFASDQAVKGGWRDKGMAKMLTTIRRDHGDHKTVVLAHAGHLAKLGEVWMDWAYSPKNLGSLLADAYGSKYRVFGVLAKSYEAHKWHVERDTEPYSTSAGSVEDDLSKEVTEKGVILDFSRSTLFPNIDPESREILGLPFGGKIRLHLDALAFIPQAPKMQLLSDVKYTD